MIILIKKPPLALSFARERREVIASLNSQAKRLNSKAPNNGAAASRHQDEIHTLRAQREKE
jgi:hypothetical protein